MKKHLSYTLLTASILGLQIFPVTAVESRNLTSSNLEETTKDRGYQAIYDGQWCVRIPAMGIFCWDL